MNIKITYNWLLEYLDTDATAADLQKYLSLCGPSVESLTKVDDDWVMDIEVTSNRIDTASVLGIAREAAAILPGFGKKAILKNNILKKELGRLSGENNMILSLKVDSSLCPRFTAIILKDVFVGPTNALIVKRLNAVGIRSINNIVDISNYIMIALGQPSHIFDYDKIKGNKMILRASKKGEKITTLDGKIYTLPGGDIVIADGSGDLIDLCGIMGGENSAVSQTTKNILVFAQTYDGARIRKTSMTLGARSTASSYFEKGLDAEAVMPGLIYAVDLLAAQAQAKIGSTLIDIYPKKNKIKKIQIKLSQIDELIGVSIKPRQIMLILKSLGFGVDSNGDNFDVHVPSYRSRDIEETADIIEEVARVYGYFNIPSRVQQTDLPVQPADHKKYFILEEKLKKMLKYTGFNEVYNYSMISKDQINLFELDEKSSLKIKNSISTEIEYLRPTLIPSILRNIKENEGYREKFSFFEIANVYTPQKSDLPVETKHLILGVNTDFYDLKGTVEALLDQFNIGQVVYDPAGKNPFFSKGAQAEIKIKNKVSLGIMGQLSLSLSKKLGINSHVFIAQLNLEEIVKHASYVQTFKPLNPFAIVKLDLTLENISSYEKTVSAIQTASRLLDRVEFLGRFKNKISIRLYFTSHQRNITEEEALTELEKIKKAI